MSKVPKIEDCIEKGTRQSLDHIDQNNVELQILASSSLEIKQDEMPQYDQEQGESFYSEIESGNYQTLEASKKYEDIYAEIEQGGVEQGECLYYEIELDVKSPEVDQNVEDIYSEIKK